MEKQWICVKKYIRQTKTKKAETSSSRPRWSCSFKENVLKRRNNQLVLEIHEITEIDNDTIPSYRIDNLPERYYEALLKTIKLIMKEKDDVMKKLNIIKIRSKCLCPSLLSENSLFVNTGAYPFISLGTTASNLISTSFSWEAVNFCWYRISKTYEL